MKRTRGWLCHFHVTGVPPGAGPFFDEECHRCRDKKARGLVTGDEPPPAARELATAVWPAKLLRSRGLVPVGAIEMLASGWRWARVADAGTGEIRGERWIRKTASGGFEVTDAAPKGRAA